MTSPDPNKTPTPSEASREYDEDKIDEAVLALLWLSRHRDGPALRAWKGHDWDAMDRLHEQGFIHNPVGKAKSVVFTEDGAKRSEELFWKLFGRDDS